METTYKDILLQILSLMDYDDKEAYVKKFQEMNHLEAMTNCIAKLPQHVQDEIVAKTASPEVVKQYVPQDKYMEEITTVSAKALVELLKDMETVLSSDQKEKINRIFNSFVQN